MRDDINTMDDLTQRIKELEELELRQMVALKLTAKQTVDGLRPSNLLKSAFDDLSSSKTFKIEALKASVGIGAGMLIKKLITHKTKGFVGRMAGLALQAITTRLVAKKFPTLKQKVANS